MSLSGVLARKGAAVTFSKESTGTYDGATGVTTEGTAVSIAGTAMEIDGDTELYLQLGLVDSDVLTLLFRPTTPGTLPDLGWTVVWGGENLTVKNVHRLAMAGSPTAAKVIVSR